MLNLIGFQFDRAAVCNIHDSCVSVSAVADRDLAAWYHHGICLRKKLTIFNDFCRIFERIFVEFLLIIADFWRFLMIFWWFFDDFLTIFAEFYWFLLSFVDFCWFLVQDSDQNEDQKFISKIVKNSSKNRQKFVKNCKKSTKIAKKRQKFDKKIAHFYGIC